LLVPVLCGVHDEVLYGNSESVWQEEIVKLATTLECPMRLNGFGERAMRGLIRAALATCLALSSAGAVAGDYSLTYAIDANGRTAAGKVESCRYERICHVAGAGLELSIFLKFNRPDEAWLSLEVEGPPYCCTKGLAYCISKFRTCDKPSCLRVT